MGIYDDPRVVYWLRDPFWGAVNHVTYRVLRLLPAHAVSWVGKQLGLAAGRYRLPEVTARAQRNLARIRPDLTAEERAGAIARMWEHVGRTIAEIAVIERVFDGARITVENGAALRAALQPRRPALLVFAHLGNWELLAAVAQQYGARLNVVFELLRNRFERSLAERSRRRLGYRLISPDRRGVREMIGALRRGEALGLAMDEFRHGNVIAPSFGRPLPARCNLRYAAKLAREFDAALVAGYCLRTAPLEFRIVCHGPIERPGAEELNALCESWIRAHPEQWYMLHRLSFG
jgi:KDO2-lipid IV(A) lauroyltransferase